MFTVKLDGEELGSVKSLFKNISCLRLRKVFKGRKIVVLPFKNISCLRLSIMMYHKYNTYYII